MDEKVNLKLKELKEALQVIQSVEDKVTWACDFTTFPVISRALEPIAEIADEVREIIQDEINYIEDRIEDYEYKLAVFEQENRIIV
jgi:hypothetical protein